MVDFAVKMFHRCECISHGTFFLNSIEYVLCSLINSHNLLVQFYIPLEFSFIFFLVAFKIFKIFFKILFAFKIFKNFFKILKCKKWNCYFFIPFVEFKNFLKVGEKSPLVFIIWFLKLEAKGSLTFFYLISVEFEENAIYMPIGEFKIKIFIFIYFYHFKP